MADFFTPEQVDYLSATTVRVDMLAAFEFASGTEYAWNGNTELTVDGNTYKPMRGYGAMEGIGLAGGTLSETVTMSLDGLPGQSLDILSKALEETPDVEQRMVTASLQLFDADWQSVGIPIPVFRGFMQPPGVTRTPMQGEEGGVQSVSLTAENIFFGRSRPPYGRNTDRDQQARSPGDKIFRFVASLMNKRIPYPDV